MYEAIATGRNECYGKKNQKIKIGDYQLLHALNMGWIRPNFKYLGNGKQFQNDREGRLKEKEIAYMPEKRIYVLTELEMQTRALNRISKEFKFIEKKHKFLVHLLNKKIKVVYRKK